MVSTPNAYYGILKTKKPPFGGFRAKVLNCAL